MPGTNVRDVAHAWEPSQRYLDRSRLRRFAGKHGHHDHASLLRWSVEDPDAFWRATEADLGLRWSRRYDQVLDTSRGVPWTTWWTGGRMNYVETALGHDPERTAIIAEAEDGTVTTLTYGELWAQVHQAAAGLRQLGVAKGDRVGLFVPLGAECAIAMLAVGLIGAVFIPIFTGYGADAIAGRLRDSEATVLICADGFRRRGQLVRMKDTADAAIAGAPSVRYLVVVRRTGHEVPTSGRDIWWERLIAMGEDWRGGYVNADTSAEDPFMVIYTSGTTGRPKGAVHVHGGFPVKAAQDLAHCFDLQERDVIFWMTDIGWMMGPWLIAGGLMLGATIVLYDGTPDFPDASRVWSMVERHRITHLGISPTAIRSLMRSGEEPVTKHDRSSLFVLGSTGEPWNPDPWWWFFRTVGESRCPVINYSGGTEISGGIIGCTTWTPIEPGSFSGPCPGMDADVVDEQGGPVRGEVGELVIRKPWPGMTRGFWKDEPGTESRYHQTYWDRLPGVWVHGDWARIDDDGFWYIEGRSDDTLKIAGKRVGPAEVESAAVANPAVSEAAAIGIPHELKGEAIVVFCILRPGHEPGAPLERSVADTIAEHLGKPLRPERVRFVRQLPKTRNSKILRRVIRGAYLGKDDLGDLSSLEDPAAIEEIRAAR